MRYLVTIFISLLAISTSANDLEPRRFITYADFSYVLYVASSIDHTYFATTEGITRYDKLNRRWEDPLTSIPGLDDRDIKKVWVDTFDENVYAATTFEMFEHSLNYDRWFPISELPNIEQAPIHRLAPSVMYTPFMYNYSGGEQLLIDPIGRNFPIADVIDDRSGVLWLGTWGEGAATAPISSSVVELLPYGLIQNRVNAIYNDDGYLFVSGAAHQSVRTGISYFNPYENEFLHIESGLTPDFPAADINCLNSYYSDLLIGTSDGLIFFDLESEIVTKRLTTRSGLIDNNIICLLPQNDSIWAGTEFGLQLINFDGDSTRFSMPVALGNLIIYDLVFADEAIWVATEEGVFRLDIKEGELQRFQDPSLILLGAVYDIDLFNEFLWFAADNGLVRLNLKNGEIEKFVDINANLTVRTVAANQRIVAFGSDNGLKIIVHAGRKQREITLTPTDGLASNYVYSLSFDGDFLWIGSDRGLTRLWWNDPKLIN